MELLTPEGRQYVCERLKDVRKAASRSAEMEERDSFPEETYTTNGASIFANGEVMSDEEALALLIQTSSLTFATFGVD